MKRQREEETQRVVLVGKKQTKTKKSKDFNLTSPNTPTHTENIRKTTISFCFEGRAEHNQRRCAHSPKAGL